jgi:hypothetical protein
MLLRLCNRLTRSIFTFDVLHKHQGTRAGNYHSNVVVSRRRELQDEVIWHFRSHLLPAAWNAMEWAEQDSDLCLDEWRKLSFITMRQNNGIRKILFILYNVPRSGYTEMNVWMNSGSWIGTDFEGRANSEISDRVLWTDPRPWLKVPIHAISTCAWRYDSIHSYGH